MIKISCWDLSCITNKQNHPKQRDNFFFSIIRILGPNFSEVVNLNIKKVNVVVSSVTLTFIKNLIFRFGVDVRLFQCDVEHMNSYAAYHNHCFTLYGPVCTCARETQ